MTQRRVSPIFVTSALPGVVTQTIRAALGQSVNIQEWQSSTGTVLGKIASDGAITLGSSSTSINADFFSTGFRVLDGTSERLSVGVAAAGTVRLNNSGGTTQIGTSVSAYGGRLNVTTGNTTTIGIAIRGTASQTANLQEWQDSAGTTIFRVASDGTPVTGSGIGLKIGGTGITGLFTVSINTSSVIGAIIRGAASQSANLQEWQNSSGTVLAYVGSTGTARFDIVQVASAVVDLRNSNSGGLITMAKATASAANPGTDYARIYFVAGTNAGTLKLVVRAGTAGAETTILDNIPQT